MLYVPGTTMPQGEQAEKMWQEIYLEAASSGYLPGCVPRFQHTGRARQVQSLPAVPELPVGPRLVSADVNDVVPPSPRLVGIELNPGPVPSGLIQDAMSAVGSALGQSLGGRTKKKKVKKAIAATIKKKIQRTTKRVLSSAAPTLLRNINGAHQNIPVSLARPRTSFAPVATHRQEFSLASFQVKSDVGGTIKLYSSDGATVSENCVNMDPSNADAFPLSLNRLAFCYTHYRFTKLKARYMPLCPSNTGGAFALGYTQEGRYLDRSVQTLAVCQSLNGSTTLCPWMEHEIPVIDLDTSWKFVFDPTTSGAAERAMDHAGAFIGVNMALAPASMLLGTVQLSGTIELSGLSNYSVAPPIATASSSSTNPPSAQAASSAVGPLPYIPRLLVSDIEDYHSVHRSCTGCAPPPSLKTT
jgi:hypothetical protein